MVDIKKTCIAYATVGSSSHLETTVRWVGIYVRIKA